MQQIEKTIWDEQNPYEKVRKMKYLEPYVELDSLEELYNDRLMTGEIVITGYERVLKGLNQDEMIEIEKMIDNDLSINRSGRQFGELWSQDYVFYSKLPKTIRVHSEEELLSFIEEVESELDGQNKLFGKNVIIRVETFVEDNFDLEEKHVFQSKVIVQLMGVEEKYLREIRFSSN